MHTRDGSTPIGRAQHMAGRVAMSAAVHRAVIVATSVAVVSIAMEMGAHHGMASIIIVPGTAHREAIAGMARGMRPAIASTIIAFATVPRVAIAGMARVMHLATASISIVHEMERRVAIAGMARVMHPAIASIITAPETARRGAIVGTAKVMRPAMAKGVTLARRRAMVSPGRMRRSLGATGRRAAVFLTERRVVTADTVVPRASAASIASAKAVRAKDSEAATRAERV